MLKYNDQNKIKDISIFTATNQIVWYVGDPGSDEFAASYPNWKVLQTVTVRDSVSGVESYKAIQYQIVNN